MDSPQAAGFAEFIEAVRKVAAEVASAHAADVDAKARFPIETLAALREYHVLSAAVPRELGGPGCNLQELSQMCATLGQHCGSSAMVLAMHYIQLACIARHGMESEWFRNYLRGMLRRQDLLASMTSEVGTFGDTRSSICAVRRSNGRFQLDKDATTGSYCAHSDAILVTCRRDEQAARSDQVLVLVRREDCTLTQTTSWDTLGMRGTCSPGFKLVSGGDEAQILPGAFADSSAQTMVPYSHVLWASLWWGIAAGAVNKAAAFVRGQARQNPGTVPPTAGRLAEVCVQLQTLKQNWLSAAKDFDALGDGPAAREELSSMAWALRLNNLKIACSEQAPEIVQRALKIVGILGYKNDSPYALGRHLRDSLSGALMISNDRIAARNASMLLVHKEAA
jgi:acyl-CoA dehydrogenase